MGAWGTGSFENDDAADWIAGLDTITPEELMRILERAADDTEYLEGPEASVAVAAAEVVAAVGGSPTAGAAGKIAAWAGKHSQALTPELKAVSIRAVERVRKNSELKDLWMEADGLNEWIAGLQDLQGRLGG